MKRKVLCPLHRMSRRIRAAVRLQTDAADNARLHLLTSSREHTLCMVVRWLHCTAGHGALPSYADSAGMSSGLLPGTLVRNQKSGSSLVSNNEIVEEDKTDDDEEPGLHSALDTVRKYLDSVNANLAQKIQVRGFCLEICFCPCIAPESSC